MKESLREITDVVDKDRVFLSTELRHYLVDGKKPDLIVFPKTIEEISEIMKVASRESLGIIPWGGGTKIGFGREPHKADVILCTRYLNRIIEYEASDLVATAECGIPLKEFQRALREKNQFLAIDPPHVQSGATLGGVIVTSDSGPRRLRFGTIRESIIGIKVIRADGSVVKGGAKVVKNVAGYDLPKLYVGSLGTLGIIVEGTFRLYPIPESSETHLASFPSIETSYEAALSILNSSLVPTCLEILNPALVNVISDKLDLNLKNGGHALAVRIESVEKAVKDQISKVKEICREKDGEAILAEGKFEESLWHEIREFPWRISGNSRTVCKASVLVTDIPTVLRALEGLSKDSGLRIYTSARAGNGVLIILIEGETSSMVGAARSLRNLTDSLKGTLVIWDAPSSLKSQVDVWGDVGSSLSVMEKLKALFDPYGILNPGRFVGGI